MTKSFLNSQQYSYPAFSFEKQIIRLVILRIRLLMMKGGHKPLDGVPKCVMAAFPIPCPISLSLATTANSSTTPKDSKCSISSQITRCYLESYLKSTYPSLPPDYMKKKIYLIENREQI